MAGQIVRCPYCVEGFDFRPMLQGREGWFICEKCHHIAKPQEPDFRCSCQKCSQLTESA